MHNTIRVGLLIDSFEMPAWIVEMTKKITEQELNYRFSNQQKEQKLIQEAKDELTAEQIKHQKLTIYAGFGGGLILIIFD